MLKVWNTWSEIEIHNDLEYEVKSYKIKKTRLKCMKLRLKGLKFNRSQKETLEWPTCMWRKKINLNIKQSRKQFQFE